MYLNETEIEGLYSHLGGGVGSEDTPGRCLFYYRGQRRRVLDVCGLSRVSPLCDNCSATSLQSKK